LLPGRGAGDAGYESRVRLITTEDRRFTVAVDLDVTPPQVSDPDQATMLVGKAHEVCPYSNATRGNIDVRLTANGREVEVAAPAA
jgi:lipoyl-dependent peroxiredoxin